MPLFLLNKFLLNIITSLTLVNTLIPIENALSSVPFFFIKASKSSLSGAQFVAVAHHKNGLASFLNKRADLLQQCDTIIGTGHINYEVKF